MSLNIIHTPLVTWATSLQLIHTLGRKMVLHPALTTYLLNKEVLNSIHLCKLNKIPMTCHVWDRGLTMRSSINAIFQKVFFYWCSVRQYGVFPSYVTRIVVGARQPWLTGGLLRCVKKKEDLWVPCLENIFKITYTWLITKLTEIGLPH